MGKFLNKKHKHIGNYKTLAEANKASIIFHGTLSETGDWELAAETTREKMLFHEKARKGVDWRERGVCKAGNRWRLQKYINKKQKQIAKYETLAEANKASIIFHDILSPNGDNWELAKEITRGKTDIIKKLQ